MKKATATSHGNNRFTDSPEGVLGAVLVLELAGIILGTNSIAGLRILANDTVGICFPSVDISTGGGQPERHSVVIVGKFSIRPQSLPKDRGKFFCVRRLIEKFFRFKLPLVQQPRQLETLDDLLAQAAHYADFCMRNSGKMAPTLFLIGADGPMMFVPASLADENEKDAFATSARLMCIAHAATVAVMALEAWMKTAKPNEEFDMTEPPSESFDRQEVIVLMGEAQGGQKQKFLPIIRSGNGKFFGFGDSNMPRLDKMEGRFAGILPPKVATDEHRTLAIAMLEVKGVNVTKPGTTVRLTPPRR